MQFEIILYTATLEGGGAEKVFVTLANYFVKKGYKVAYACAYGDSYLDLLDSRVVIKRCYKKPLFENKKLNKVSRVLGMPLFMWWLLVSNRRAHLLTSVMESDMLGNLAHYFALSKGKLILVQAGLVEDVTHPGNLSFFLKNAYRRSKFIVANAPATRASIINFESRIANKIKLIGNPVYKSQPAQSSSGKERYLLHVGRFESQKDHTTLLKAFQMVVERQPIRLKLVGSGSLENEIRALSAELGIDSYVDFVGFINDPDAYYAKATALVLSSTHETFGNVIVEAMAHGIPVVSTRSGGPDYLINDNSLGELCEVNKPQALATAILKVVRNPENYSSAMSKRRAEDFSIEKIGKQYLEILS